MTNQIPPSQKSRASNLTLHSHTNVKLAQNQQGVSCRVASGDRRLNVRGMWYDNRGFSLDRIGRVPYVKEVLFERFQPGRHTIAIR
jgi:hypothetical protein